MCEGCEFKGILCAESEKAQNRVLVLDIDNIVAKHNDVWLEYLYNQTGHRFTDTAEAKNTLGEKYAMLKEMFRCSGLKRTMPVVDEQIPEIIKKLKSQGWQVVFVSSRPAYENLSVAKDTLVWLLFRDIAVDGLFFTKQKLEFVQSNFGHYDRCVMLEDEEEFIAGNTEGVEVFHIQKTEDVKSVLLGLLSEQSK